MGDLDQETIERMKIKTENFFREAFCANSAKVILPYDPDKFKISCIVEIKTDDRGTFFTGLIEKI